jgi:hypothetical protein
MDGAKHGIQGAALEAAVGESRAGRCLEHLQSRTDIASAALQHVGLQEQSLHLAAFDLLLLLDHVERECEGRSRGKPALQRREQVACLLLSGHHDAWR